VPRPRRKEVEGKPLADLHELAAGLDVQRYRLLRREQLIAAISGEEAPPPPSREAAPSPAEPHAVDEEPAVDEAPAVDEQAAGEIPLEELEGELRSGVLDLVGDGYGFVRVEGLGRSDADPYVSRTLVRRFGLRRGDEVGGLVSQRDRRPRMVSIETVQGRPASEQREEPPPLDEEPAQRPSRPLLTQPSGAAARMIEIVAPLGKGQRALISGPPGSGATTLLRELADELSRAGVSPEVTLIDVRPEEVPEWERTGLSVAAAPAGSSPREQIALAELALEQAKRAAERGEDAVLVLDSLSRLARAYGLARGNSDDAGAMGPAAVESVKRWFAAARDAPRGSLTVIAASRVESDSAFETLVHESLEDSASVVVRLDAELAARGMYPAIDASRSRTLGEEALVDSERRRILESMRGVMRSLDPAESWEFLAEKAREPRWGDPAELPGSEPGA
jgi:transcription termination factor Rho